MILQWVWLLVGTDFPWFPRDEGVHTSDSHVDHYLCAGNGGWKGGAHTDTRYANSRNSDRIDVASVICRLGLRA